MEMRVTLFHLYVAMVLSASVLLTFVLIIYIGLSFPKEIAMFILCSMILIPVFYSLIINKIVGLGIKNKEG